MTSQLIPSFSSFSAAVSDSHTKWPVETIVTSFPDFNNNPLPILKS